MNMVLKCDHICTSQFRDTVALFFALVNLGRFPRAVCSTSGHKYAGLVCSLRSDNAACAMLCASIQSLWQTLAQIGQYSRRNEIAPTNCKQLGHFLDV
jgi:hypothetical protein